jgi:MtN3 and saliva related transmembrane protein
MFMFLSGLPIQEIIGYVAGICTAISFLPQTIRTIKTQDVNGLSLLSYVIYAIGLLSWIIYGAYLNSLQMMIFNTPAFIFALIIIGEIIYNRYMVKEK